MEPSDESLVTLVVLLVDEVVTNAVVHGQGPIDLAIDADEVRVKVMVRDRSETCPACPCGRRRTPREAEACPSSRRSPRDGVSSALIRERRCGSRSTAHPAPETELAARRRSSGPFVSPERGNRLVGHGVPGAPGMAGGPVNQVMEIDGQPECRRPIVPGQQGDRLMVRIEVRRRHQRIPHGQKDGAGVGHGQVGPAHP